jgi:glycogen operon protein
VLWTEWNGKYRDCVRRFWRGDGGTFTEFATRLAGSSDLYEHSGRRPHASINFVTCHDGFTLQDLVSYNEKHNEANGEENRDGSNDNLSWNCGAEGPADGSVDALREQQKRNFMATLLFSQGVAMILGGDELSHTQIGNNNAYCQDNQITWLNWELDGTKRDFLEFVRRIIRIRLEQPVLRRRRFFHGRAADAGRAKDLTWLNPSGQEMTDADWNAGFVRTLGVLLNGDAIVETDERGERIVGDSLLVLLNAHDGAIPFTVPALRLDEPWVVLLDTAEPSSNQLPGNMHTVAGNGKYELHARSLALLRLPPVPLTAK